MSINIPDLHATWPFPKLLNPYFTEEGHNSCEWILSYPLYDPKRHQQFRSVNGSLLAARAYPQLGKAHFRLGCDLVNILFATDDVTDKMDGQETQKIKDIIIDAIENPEKPRPKHEHALGEMHRCLWSSIAKVASATIMRRITILYASFIRAVTQEVNEKQNRGRHYSFDEYVALRRCTGGCLPAFQIILLSLDIPEAILEDQRVIRLENLAADMIDLANDVASYNAEQARGDIHNAIVVLMRERGLDTQGAMEFVHDWYRRSIDDYLDGLNNLPVCNDRKVGDDLRGYILGIANWVTANWEWSFESERYFQKTGEEVKLTGVVRITQG